VAVVFFKKMEEVKVLTYGPASYLRVPGREVESELGLIVSMHST